MLLALLRTVRRRLRGQQPSGSASAAASRSRDLAREAREVYLGDRSRARPTGTRQSPWPPGGASLRAVLLDRPPLRDPAALLQGAPCPPASGSSSSAMPTSGTALVLGDVVEADDSYTGEHCKGVVRLALDALRGVGARRTTAAQRRVRRAPARRRQDRRSQGDHRQARQARRARVGRSSRHTRSRARRCSSGSAV